ncbi:MAG TPA: MFS transporter [Magnetospirillaceae bacterium]|jgi:MFS family permease
MGQSSHSLPMFLRDHQSRVGQSRSGAGVDTIVLTDVPARLDRLPWSGFHWLMVVALGITWILDGLEVTLVGSLAGALANDNSIALSSTQIGAAASSYLVGAVLGSLLFGYLTDKLGRRRLFYVTLLLYIVATIATGCSWNFWSFAVFRFFTGAGIGGEYVAINSAIQELTPARYRGWTDLTINGSFWIGAALGAVGSLAALDPSLVNPAYGWRLPFAIGGVLGLLIVYLRRFVPESPRWLATHGRVEEAEQTIVAIEDRVRRSRGSIPNVPAGSQMQLKRRDGSALMEVMRTIIHHYPQRTVLCIVLMAAQAFFYNAIFFTYALVLTKFYAVQAGSVGDYILPFALGNVCGPLLLGRLFDHIGRKTMIAATYAISGVLMIVTAWLFAQGYLSATSQTICWTVIFFFASAAASSAYLTVSESFPLEVRGLIIALFYAAGTLLGGIAGPAIFGALIDSGSRNNLMWGYMVSAALMLIAAGTEAMWGVAAERRSLESIAPPLSAIDR